LVAAELVEFVCCEFSPLFPEFSLSLNHKIKTSLANQLKIFKLRLKTIKTKICKASFSSNSMNKYIIYVEANL
jgi:hypothetical protein